MKKRLKSYVKLIMVKIFVKVIMEPVFARIQFRSSLIGLFYIIRGISHNEKLLIFS